MCHVNPFMQGAWYSLWDYSRLDSNGTNITLTVPQGDIAVHLRGGSIIPLQVSLGPQQEQARFAEDCCSAVC
jgi:alpha-glucosidase (family GH31 glycosyl hydrolase)